jgi:hypothetical protein
MKVRLATVLGVWLLATSSAFATNLPVYYADYESLLKDPGANYGCPAGSANCLTSLDFQLAGPSSPSFLSSIIVGDDPNLPAGQGSGGFNLSLAGATFAPSSGVGSSELFSDVWYQASVPTFSSPSVITQIGPGAGLVYGSLNGTPFSVDSVVSDLACTLSGTTGHCSLVHHFTVDGHDWLHTLDFGVTASIPEPAAAGLVVLGLGSLALRRRGAQGDDRPE